MKYTSIIFFIAMSETGFLAKAWFLLLFFLVIGASPKPALHLADIIFCSVALSVIDA